MAVLAPLALSRVRAALPLLIGILNRTCLKLGAQSGGRCHIVLNSGGTSMVRLGGHWSWHLHGVRKASFA